MSDGHDPVATVAALLAELPESTAGVTEAVVVSSDGLVVARSPGLEREAGERFAAVASGLIGLAYGAAGRFGGGAVREVVIEMEHAFIFVTGIVDGSSLAVATTASCDVGEVGYAMAVLVDRLGALLTPEVRDALRSEQLR